MLNHTRRRRSIAQTAAQFERFSQAEGRRSALYSFLAREIARDVDLLELAHHAPDGQAVPYLFFAVVQYSLLRDRHDAIYERFLGAPCQIENQAVLREFTVLCRQRHDALARMLSDRCVQANDPRRSVFVLPAIAWTQRHLDNRPMVLIEIGASAGLNLFFDRYSYHYYPPSTRLGDCDSPVQLDCSLEGHILPPLVFDPSLLADRIGIDHNPLNLAHAGDRLWLRSFIWPGDSEGERSLSAAMNIASGCQPDIVKGDAVDVLGDIIAAAAVDLPVCILATTTLYQIPASKRRELYTVMSTASNQRRIICLSVEVPSILDMNEPLDDRRTGVYSILACSDFVRGIRNDRVLAVCGHRGSWLEWLA